MPRALDAVRRLVRWRFPKLTQISTAELADWLSDPARVPPVLLDVRPPAEYAVSHLARARRVDPGAAAASVLGDLPPDQPIVVYCSAGYRSSILAQRLHAAGRKHVANFDGAIFKWANEGRPLERDGKLTREVHPYSLLIGRLMLLPPPCEGAG